MIRKPIWIGSSMVACAGERAIYTRTDYGARASLSQSTAASPRAFRSNHGFTFHHVGYFGFRIISALGISPFFFELGALHRQWCCPGSLEHRISVITAALPLALPIQHFSLHISVTLFSVLGAGRRTDYGTRASLPQSTAASPRAFRSNHGFTFHHVGYFGFRIIPALGISPFFFELGALHRQWCCPGSLEHRISVITAALPLALPIQHFSLHISVTLFSVLGTGRNMAESDAFEQERCVGTVAVRPCSVYKIIRVHPISDGTKKLTRADIAKNVSRDQILRRERG